MRWRLKKRPLRHIEVKFSRKPSPRWAKEAAKAAMKLPLRSWPALAVLGRFLNAYFYRFKREWRGTDLEMRRALADIESLIEREGTEWAIKGIDTVFSDKMRWVNAHLSALMNANFFRDYIVPASQKGEQSEWRGDRGEEGSRKVTL